MKISPIASNMTKLTFETNGHRHEVLFSYETPVALRQLTPEGMLYFKTDKFWSTTTSRHIGKFINKDLPITEMPQEWFNELIAGVNK